MSNENVVTAAANKPKPGGKKPQPAAAPAKPKGVSGNELKVLTALLKAGKSLSRNDLAIKTGIRRGWSKMLGAHTKEIKPNTLQGRGLVKAVEVEGERAIQYVVTAAGKKAIEKAGK